MIAKLQKFADSISIDVRITINIIESSGRGMIRYLRYLISVFSVVGFEYSGLRYLTGTLSGRGGRLAYCRQEAKAEKMPSPLVINNQREWNNDR
ncbi:MAG: hypothetical protein KAR31_00810 [Candidatus Omnitrophica bacterium]|nr:hypothetical protein [Candidatus Omnitrophota bacterium]MCK5180723.1 hypothetical protein [Candidatus Omnitrophota bacterium]MCK5259950.1 hypothetical protein [Candidatus Omnitrophota bacterium]